MSARIRRNFDVLKVLKKSSSKVRKAILQNADKDLLFSLCEIISNVLNGNVKLSSADKKKLSKHKAALRKLADRRTSLGFKRKLLIQKGGFLASVLIPALGVLASLLIK